jgi:signal transduction histidine kinase
MKHSLKILFLCLAPMFGQAQNNADSLKSIFKNGATDSLKFDAAMNVSVLYRTTDWKWDSAAYYADQGISLARKNHQKISEAHALIEKGRNQQELGDFASALQCYLQAFEIAKDPDSEKKQYWVEWENHTQTESRLRELAYVHQMYGSLMQRTGNEKQGIFHYLESARLAKQLGSANLAVSSFSNAGRSYLKMNKLDSAVYCMNEAEKTPLTGSLKFFTRSLALLKGDIYRKQGKDSLGLQQFYTGLMATLQDTGWRQSPSNIYLRLSNYHYDKANKDSALYYARRNLESIQASAKAYRVENNLGDAYENLYLCFLLSNQRDSAFKYQGMALAAKDSLYKLQIKNLSAFQQKNLSEQLRLQNVEKEKEAYQNQIRTYALLTGLVIFLMIAGLLYRNNRQKQKSNSLLAKQKEKVESTLSELKATQSQLVQSEKMASLGELTAGIAHEIQNPLNFVNNFSEVNTELIDELEQEISKGNLDEIRSIAKDIRENERKINHHGKRADSIVKSMLQHSRSSSGKKEPTDINDLADEYLRLAYHGLRAKDKSFNAKFETTFDNSIGKVNIISQDIGRVLVNLINNAFYAVYEKKKHETNGYEPAVAVSTKKKDDKIEIKIRDNGNGIPQKVLDKIFQPFFTTKPTGQGTGLGLSLSYDIIKAHGGEIKVETKEKEGTEFIIQLPQKFL